MSDLKQERQIHRLLLQREREFTAVWRVECEVNKILGAGFPFESPPLLPSSKKPVKKKAAPRKRAVRLAKVATLIRPLQDLENAYKVTYTCGSDSYESVHVDTALIRQLLPLKTDSFTMRKVETIQLFGKAEHTVCAELWNESVKFQV